MLETTSYIFLRFFYGLTSSSICESLSCTPGILWNLSKR